jgi:environmental stress-induced protein Ves
MIRLIPQVSFVEGRWRNGQGVSWEIASHKKADAADFSWRFAKARIDNDVPFSIYPGMDRISKMERFCERMRSSCLTNFPVIFRWCVNCVVVRAWI